jgi:hypothetical protein
MIERPNSNGNLRELSKKEWRRPDLKKLPIAATAGSKGQAGDEGNTSKNGDANPMRASLISIVGGALSMEFPRWWRQLHWRPRAHCIAAVAAAPDHRHRDRSVSDLRGRRNDGATTHRKLPDQAPEVLTLAEADSLSSNGTALSPRELSYCVLRLGNLDSGAFERLGRYNVALWKQKRIKRLSAALAAAEIWFCATTRRRAP